MLSISALEAEANRSLWSKASLVYRESFWTARATCLKTKKKRKKGRKKRIVRF